MLSNFVFYHFHLFFCQHNNVWRRFTYVDHKRLQRDYHHTHTHCSSNGSLSTRKMLYTTIRPQKKISYNEIVSNRLGATATAKASQSAGPAYPQDPWDALPTQPKPANQGFCIFAWWATGMQPAVLDKPKPKVRDCGALKGPARPFLSMKINTPLFSPSQCVHLQVQNWGVRAPTSTTATEVYPLGRMTSSFSLNF